MCSSPSGPSAWRSGSYNSGKSGFWWLIGFIPIIGTITLIVFYCLSGTPGPNKYDA